MQIKWTNLIALCVLVFAIVLALKSANEVSAILGTLQFVGPSHSMDERFIGFIVLGVLLVTLVMLAKILIRNDGNRQ